MKSFFRAIWGGDQAEKVPAGVAAGSPAPIQTDTMHITPAQERSCPNPPETLIEPDPAFLSDAPVEPSRPPEMPPVEAVDAADAPPRPVLGARPEVSVVIGSFNRVDLLPLAIQSVRDDMADIPHEIIVIDGGSSDGTIDWLLGQEDVVTIIQNNRYKVDGEVRRRMSWGRFMNLGFKGSVGKYVLMISDDCYLAPGSTRAALDRAQAAEDAGHRIGGVAYYFRNWPDDDQFYVQRTLGGNMMINHGLYSREALEEVGFAEDEAYVFYKCDTDLSLKIWSEGYSIIDSESSVCEHFFEAEEQARTTNNATMDFDRYVMRKRWPDLLGKAEVSKMGRIDLAGQPDFSIEALWRPIMEQRTLARQKAASAPKPRARAAASKKSPKTKAATTARRRSPKKASPKSGGGKTSNKARA